MGKKAKSDKALLHVLAEILAGERATADTADTLAEHGYPSDDASLAALDAVGEACRAGALSPAHLAGANPSLIEATVSTLRTAQDVSTLVRLRGAADKGVRKSAGAALHILASQGVHLPEAAPAAAVFSLAAEVPTAAITALDTSGRRILYLYSPSDGQLFSILMGEDGTFEATVEDGKRGDLEVAVRGFEAATGLPHTLVPLSHALYLLDQGTARARQTGRFVGLEVQQLMMRTRRTHPAAPAIPQGVLTTPPLIGDEPSSMLVQLYSQPEIGQWELTPEALTPGMGVLVQASQSTLVLSAEAQAEHQKKVIREAAALVFGPELRQILGERLLDVCAMFSLTGRSALVPTAAGVATALLDTTIPAGEIPFARDFFVLNLMRLSQGMAPPPEGGPQPTEAQADSPLIIPG